ncbi:hypothetical protein ACQY0O_007708 [Thecaphora frezii]
MTKKPSKAEKARQRRTESQPSRGRARAAARAATAPSSLLAPDRQAAFEHRRRTVQLQESAFAKLSPPVLEKLNLLSSYALLQRPIQPNTTQFGWDRFGKARANHFQNDQQRAQVSAQHNDAHQANRRLSEWLTSSLTHKRVHQARPNDQHDDEHRNPSATSTPTPSTQGPEQPHELRLPKRPRWRSDMDTKTVQSNEEEVFRTWLQQTDAVVEHAFFTSSPLFHNLRSNTFHTDLGRSKPEWMGGSRMTASILSPEEIESHKPNPDTAIIGSLYERNIEVFRQLWRVCERSDLVCVLADARCPPLHLPPSLTAFLERYMRLKVVIVLTKADIVPAPIVNAWKAWLKHQFPQWEIVATESYTKVERLEGQGSRTRYTPYLSPMSRTALFAALRRAHKDLITPPPAMKEDPARLRTWSPPCATEIDWDGIESRVSQHSDPGSDPDTHQGAATASSVSETEHVSTDSHDSNTTTTGASNGAPSSGATPSPFLTVGLIGQPNVGKSSLLNALFGSKVVRASKTPGKTKHFQTHFLSPHDVPTRDRRGEIRLCDSPGLVFPSLVGMEMQVMGAILPISQVQALTSVVRFVGQHMPLEQVTRVHTPEAAQQDETEGDESWTSVRILECVAERYGWRTAKANRWDVNRAGNAVMRAVAEGRIRWAFRPPSSSAYASSPSQLETSPSPLTDEKVGRIGDDILDGAVEKGDGVWLDGYAKSYWEGIEGADDEEDVLLQKREVGEDEEADGEGKKVRFQHGDEDANEDEEAVGESDDDGGSESEPEEQGDEIGATTSRFAALMVEDDEEDNEESEDEQG